jgi:hypothetical protein
MSEHESTTQERLSAQEAGKVEAEDADVLRTCPSTPSRHSPCISYKELHFSSDVELSQSFGNGSTEPLSSSDSSPCSNLDAFLQGHRTGRFLGFIFRADLLGGRLSSFSLLVALVSLRFHWL